MTPCHKLGYKVGDRFVVVAEETQSQFYAKGDIVTLLEDDGTDCPFFHTYNHVHVVSCKLEHLRKIGEDTPDPKMPCKEPNKYVRNIHGVEVDVYDVLKAWNVTCPATTHAIKKLLMPGQRGSKDKLQDLKEAEQSIKRAIELNN